MAWVTFVIILAGLWSLTVLALDLVILCEFFKFAAKRKSWRLGAALVVGSICIGGLWGLMSRSAFFNLYVLISNFLPIAWLIHCKYSKAMPNNKWYALSLKLVAIPCSLAVLLSIFSLVGSFLGWFEHGTFYK